VVRQSITFTGIVAKELNQPAKRQALESAIARALGVREARDVRVVAVVDVEATPGKQRERRFLKGETHVRVDYQVTVKGDSTSAQVVAVKGNAMSLKNQASGSGMQGIVAEVAQQTGVPASGIQATATAPTTFTPEGGVGSPSPNREGNGNGEKKDTDRYFLYFMVSLGGLGALVVGGVCVYRCGQQSQEKIKQPAVATQEIELEMNNMKFVKEGYKGR
jgi:hypothetical protein